MKEILSKTIEYLEKVVPNFKKTRGKNINFTCPQCLSEEPTCHLISPTVPIMMCAKCGEKGKGRLGNVAEYYSKVRNCTQDEVLQDIVKVLSLTTPAPKTLKEFLDFYEQMKFDLVPVSRNNKAPIEMAWTTKTHTDRKEWESWLENKLNIGVKTGECSNVTVIDIDTSEIPEEIEKLKGEEVLIQKSRQGWHLFYQYEPELVTTRIDEMKIDILNNGKQCILYPSEIDGYFRQFVTDLKPITKMPPALRDYIKEKTGKNPVTKTFSEILKEDIQTENFHSDVIQEGNRNNFMIRLGGILKKELNLGQVCYTLDIINRHFCKPSLDPREFRNLINQIDKYVSNDLNDTTSKVLAYLKLVGEATGRDIQEVLGEKKEIVDKVLAHLMREGLVLRKNRMYIAVKRADWQQEFPTLSPEVPFKVPYFNDVAHFNYGDMILLGGRSKVGKTTQAMNIIKRFVAQGVKPHYMYLETGCFDEETELLTNNGWKNLDSILETDKVLSLNPMEGFSVYKPITHIFKENYKGKMLSYKNDAVDFKITPNHKIYYRSEYEDFYELDEIREVIKHNKSIRFKTNFKLRDNHFRVSEIKIGEKYFNRTALMKFLGWFISEGNLTGTDIPEHSKKRKVWKIQITQRKEAYKKELLTMFSELGFTPKTSRGEVYYIDSKELYVWLRTYCYHPELKRMRRSYIKYIPEIVMEATPDDIRVFLDSYIMGDGHFSIRKDGTRINHISTAQKHLADSLQLLMLKLGKSASLKFYKNSTLGCYRVTEIIENEVQVKKDKITEEDYDGRIWCVETKPYHLVFARRNGYCYWSGNSRFLKTALTLGLKEGDFYHAFVSDPTKVELEKNAVTILDWLLIDNYAETDKVLKYFVEQLNKTNGFLIIFMQLKDGDNWFAPNMIHFFPALAARYIYDKVETGYGTTGAWVVDTIRDPKNHVKGGNLPCTYDWRNKTLNLNGEIDEKEEKREETPF